MTEACRIYAPDGDLYAEVDEIDFAWAAQWRWSPKWSRGGSKVYMRRVGHEGTRTARTQRTIWLHRVIVIERMLLLPPTPAHTIVGHADGDEMNCRRSNLLWETHSSNAAGRRPNGTTIRRRLGL